MSKYDKEDLWGKLFMMMPNKFFHNDLKSWDQLDYLEEIELCMYALFSSEQYSLFGRGYYSIVRITKLINMYPNTENKKRVHEALKNLVDLEYIVLHSESQGEDEISVDKLKPSDVFYVNTPVDIELNEDYTKVYYDEFCKILEIPKVNTSKLFKLYMHITCRMYESDYSDKTFYGTIQRLMDETFYDKKTIMKYMSLLCEYQILVGATVHTKNTSKNYFTRKRNESYLDHILKEKYGPDSKTSKYVTGIEFIGQTRKDVS